jgi:hypothetical protein
MVHALLQAHRILRSNCWLINIHDLPAPHRIEVHVPETVKKVGWLLDSEEFANEHAAYNALAQVVTDGYFILEDERDFGYNISVDYLNELQEWLEEWWTTAMLPDRTIQQIKEIIGAAGQLATIVLIVQSRMIKLRAV